MSNFNSADIAAFKAVWVFCEQREGKLMPTDFELISKGRVQFGKPISKFQNTQFTFADMCMRIEAARLLTYQAAVLKLSLIHI